MTTLIGRSDNLFERVSALQEKRALAKRSNEFHTRADQLARASNDVQRMASLSEDLKENGIIVNFISPERKALSARAAALAEAFAANPESIVQPQTSLERSLIAPLSALISDMESDSLEAWKKKADEMLVNIPEGLLRTLGSIKTLAPSVQQLRDIQSSGRSIASSLPTGGSLAVASALAEMEKLSRQSVAVLDALNDIPEDVIAFLQRATVGQARLSDLTDSVHQWLTREKLIDSVRLALD